MVGVAAGYAPGDLQREPGDEEVDKAIGDQANPGQPGDGGGVRRVTRARATGPPPCSAL